MQHLAVFILNSRMKLLPLQRSLKHSVGLCWRAARLAKEPMRNKAVKNDNMVLTNKTTK
jgi:hypothetical protein